MSLILGTFSFTFIFSDGGLVLVHWTWST